MMGQDASQLASALAGNLSLIQAELRDFQAVMETASAGKIVAMVLDAEEGILLFVRCNRAAEEILRGSVAGKRDSALIPPEILPTHRGHVRLYLEGKRPNYMGAENDREALLQDGSGGRVEIVNRVSAWNEVNGEAQDFEQLRFVSSFRRREG